MIYLKSYCYSTHELPFVIANLTEGFNYIDKLVLYEYNYTHTGKPKNYEMETVLHLVPETLRAKLDYRKIDLSPYIETTDNESIIHTVNEPIQRSAFFNDSTYTLTNDTVIIDVDIDEIIYSKSYPKLLRELNEQNQPLSIRLNQFYYRHTYLWTDCNFSSPTIYTYDMVRGINTRIKGLRIQNLRDLPTKTQDIHGCHMSWVMPVDYMLKKLHCYGHLQYRWLADKNLLEAAIQGKKYPFDPATPFTIEELPLTDERIPTYLRTENIFNYKLTTENIWETRYIRGENSGAGSYGDLCIFKTNVLNTHIRKHNIQSIFDFGCGDGNQIENVITKNYVGVDISKRAVSLCRERYSSDSTKTFYYVGDYKFDKTFDMTMSLDVIYHILEDDLYRDYINKLFHSSNKWVVIYSSNYSGHKDQHMYTKKFTDDIAMWFTNFSLVETIPQLYPNKSSADFYIFKKI